MTDSAPNGNTVQLTHNAWLTTLLVVANVSALAAIAVIHPKDWLNIIIMPSETVLIDAGANFGPFSLIFGQGWRLLTCAFLHKGVIHLVLNMIALWYLGSRAERLIGPLRLLVVCLFTAVGASLASILWRADGVSVGSSGIVFGLIGLMVALGQRGALPATREYAVFTGLPGIIFASFTTLLGLCTPQIDSAAHCGGLVLGLICGFAFADEDNFAKMWSMRSTLITAISAVLLGGGYVSESTVLVEQNPGLQALGEEQRAASLFEGKDPKKDPVAFESALKHIDRAIELNPEKWKFHIEKSQLLVGLKRFDEALAECDIASRAVDKDLETIYNQRSYVLHKAGRNEKAVDCYTELLSFYDDQSTPKPGQIFDLGAAALAKRKALVYNNRAWSYLVLNDYDRALKDVDRSLELDPSMGTAYDTKGVILFYKQQYKEALDVLTKAIKVNSSGGEGYWHRSKVYKAMGDEKNASEDLLKAKLREYEPEEWELNRQPGDSSH